MNTIKLVSALCGAGKSWSLQQWIISNPDQKIIISVPTIALSNQYFNSLSTSLDIHSVYLINSESKKTNINKLNLNSSENYIDSELNVKASILATIDLVNIHKKGVLIISQQAFETLPLFNLISEWTIAIDEMFDLYKIKQLTIPFFIHTLLKYIKIDPSFDNDGVYKLIPKTNKSISKFLNIPNDDALSLIKDIIIDLDNKDDIFVNKTNWDNTINKIFDKGSKPISLEFITCKSPEKYSHFKDVIFLGAHLEYCPVFKYWNTYYNIETEQFSNIYNKIPSKFHTNGDLVNIYYIFDGNYTKALRNTKILGTMSIGQMMHTIFETFFEDEKQFLYVTNSDDTKYIKNAFPLNVKSHGMNSYDHFSNFGFNCSLNRSRVVNYIIESLNFISKEDLSDWELYNVCYQGACRTSIRTVETKTPVNILVTCKSIADGFTIDFPDCKIEKLECTLFNSDNLKTLRENEEKSKQHKLDKINNRKHKKKLTDAINKDKLQIKHDKRLAKMKELLDKGLTINVVKNKMGIKLLPTHIQKWFDETIKTLK